MAAFMILTCELIQVLFILVLWLIFNFVIAIFLLLPLGMVCSHVRILVIVVFQWCPVAESSSI
jgi:hypothetical protein